ncbi:MAG: hypothetical protein JNJ49_04125 [Bdellovibrionaceae bacterium]|nr:hypothetical protein [Pseudobdellovibrionaceae bacterium]
MSPDQLTCQINEWFKSRGFKHVSIAELNNPIKDSSYESNIVRELKFQPDNMRALSIEVWICDNGSLGFGIDRRARVANILGFSSQSKQFAGGKEPVALTTEALIAILNLVADGHVGMSYVALPYLGALSICPNLDQKHIEELAKSDILYADYNFKSLQKWNLLRRTIQFEPWT